MTVVPYKFYDEWVPMRDVLNFCDPVGITDVGEWMYYLLREYRNVFVDLSIDNVEVCADEHKCRLKDDTPIPQCEQPGELRWYQRIQTTFQVKVLTNANAATARAMLEYVLGCEPFYDADPEIYEQNLINLCFTFERTSQKFPEIVKYMKECIEDDSVVRYSLQSAADDYQNFRMQSDSSGGYWQEMKRLISEYEARKSVKKPLTPPGSRNSCSKAQSNGSFEEGVEVQCDEPLLPAQQ